MEMTNLQEIQSELGYNFKNWKLLCQAFTRKSYTEENKDALNNEVLEFYGDKALEFIVMKKMSEYYGSIGAGDLFYSIHDEGDLTEIKKKLVCREMLASKIRRMDFQKRMLVGKGDFEQKVWEQESVQEDLFEAIIGAVAIDSGWNIDVLTKVIERMLNPEFYFKNGFEKQINYVEMLQQWSYTKYHMPPNYTFMCNEQLHENGKSGYQCTLSISPFAFFNAWGENKSQAKMAVAEKAYEYLEKNNLLCSLVDVVGKPDLDRAVNQLQELYQKGYICEPQYVFLESHDEKGNPIWHCNCYVPGINYPDMGSAFHSSKRQAKKIAALKIVTFFLNEED